MRGPVLALALFAPLLAPPVVHAEVVSALPLERGFYVRSDATCRTASLDTLALLTRQGLQWSGSACTFGRIEKLGPTTYRVEQTCDGPGKATATWQIRSPTAFSFKDANGWEHTASLCPQKSLPEPWRSNDVSGLIK